MLAKSLEPDHLIPSTFTIGRAPPIPGDPCPERLPPVTSAAHQEASGGTACTAGAAGSPSRRTGIRTPSPVEVVR